MGNIKSENIAAKSVLRVVVILLMIPGLSACLSSEGSTSRKDSDTAERSIEELSELYWARRDSALMDFTESEVMFMTEMIIHHAQALIMSRLAPGNGASPSVQTLASRIINAQQDEINTMQNWLRVRNQQVPEIQIEGLSLMVHGLGDRHMGTDHSDMAGMLSPSELEELNEARGREFDRLFLKFMISHHQGGVLMVTQLFNADVVPRDELAFKMASDIQVDQRTEIDRMQLMLDNIVAAD